MAKCEGTHSHAVQIKQMFSRHHLLKIARKHGRMKLWDIALEHGLNGTRAGLAILKHRRRNRAGPFSAEFET